MAQASMETITQLCAEIEKGHTVDVIRPPTACVTMAKARDGVNGADFFLGEVLLTECRVRMGAVDGIGVVIGDDPERAYGLAVFDAAFNADQLPPQWLSIVQGEEYRFSEARQQESRLVGATRVQFETYEDVP
ncbi:MAG: phosphonate C-P lyase system protein PhnG [Firmicutes bacterium]|nr:phosphonate C-P lyase system protein PhnG [Bacillota bacterium]